MRQASLSVEGCAELTIAFLGQLKAFLLAQQVNEFAKSIFIGNLGLPEFEQQAHRRLDATRACLPTLRTVVLRTHTLPEEVSHSAAAPVGPLAIGFVAEKRPAHPDLIGSLPFLQPILTPCFQLAGTRDIGFHGFDIQPQ